MRSRILGGLTALLLVVPSAHRLGAEAPLYTVQDLGTIDGVAPTVTGINASGQVSGFVRGATGVRAVRFRGAAADEKRGGNFGAGLAFGRKLEDEQFALG